jgi:trans-aconitate 2-methyltransferase
VAGAWDPAQYERFKDERSRPFFDLLALVQPAPGGHVVDLGCGTGELTRVLHARVNAGQTLGIDLSPEMLARSAPFAGEGVRFERGDIAAFAPSTPYDIVFSNAALHWVPDHAALLRRLSSGLRPGGQLAVQVPANHDHLSHWVARAVAESAPSPPGPPPRCGRPA